MGNQGTLAKSARFGAFELDLRTGELRRHGLKARLQEKPFQILAALLEHPGEVVTREELRKRLWPEDTFVDFEHSLNNAVNRLRETLGDSSETPLFIETLPRHGYRFMAPVEFDGASEAPAPQPRRSGKRVIASGVAAGLILAAGYLAWRQTLPPPEPRRVRMAVLPFENLTGDAQQDYVSDGLTEELITRLSRVNPSELAVIARTSAMTYKGKREPVRNIGRQLGVDYVVEGSLRREGEGYRVTAQLVRTRDEVHLWAQAYDRDFRELLAVQAEVAFAIAGEINVSLVPAQAALALRAGNATPEVYQLYLRGRYQMNQRSREGLEQAVSHFQQAVEKDPGFARAHSGLADSYLLLAWYGHISNRQGFPRALAASQKALSLDPSLAEAHTTTAFLSSLWLTDWNAAERGFQTALELDPAYVTAHHWYALHLTALNRLDEAIGEMEEAVRLDPLSPAVRSGLAYVLYFARQHDRAIVECETALSLAPDFLVARAVRGWSLVEKGNYDQGISELQTVVQLSGGVPRYRAGLGRAFALAGRRDEATHVLKEMELVSRDRWIAPSEWAIVHAALGEADEAFERLSKSPDEGDGFVLFLRVAPEFDPLRADPRFQELLRRMNLPR